jgi:hypothetical protein
MVQEKFISEDDLDPKIYDEADSDDSATALRTLIEFELYKTDTGEMITLDELETEKGNVSLKGKVVQPLPHEWREKIVSILCSGPVEKSIEATSDSTVANMNITESPKLDWDALKIGDYVDGYCFKTYNWYEAKVIQVDKEKDRYKVHFQGWNSKYDEWVPKFSERLVPFKTSQLVAEQAEKVAAIMLPWYEHNSIIQRVEKLLNASYPKLQTQSIVINDVEDFCIDYTYPNPTLWIISGTSAIWYRIAGALVPYKGCEGFPNDVYRPLFTPAKEKFLCAGHVCMALMDIMQSMPNAGFQIVVDEVTSRTRGKINELVILNHYLFLVDQLITVELPTDWNIKTTIAKSLFIQQLKKEGENFDKGGGLQGLMVRLIM